MSMNGKSRATDDLTSNRGQKVNKRYNLNPGLWNGILICSTMLWNDTLPRVKVSDEFVRLTR